MASRTESFNHLASLLPDSEVHTPSSPEFSSLSSVFATNKDLHPKVVVQPSSLSSLQKVIAYLATTDLDWKVRSQGFGSASAKDVLVNLAAFNGFEINETNDPDQPGGRSVVVTLGAGQNWGQYHTKMRERKPGYAIVAARTPCIGVGGSTLSGGFSWLSAEFGCVSDPENMLDAQVVKLDGSVIWASEEPDLLWALRGTETGFGVVTAFKFRARPYTTSIYSGPILLPRDSVREAAKGLVAMDRRRPRNLKVSTFLYVMPKEHLQFINAEDDMLVVHAFDAMGEEHGRSAEGFKWALDIPGAIDQTKVADLKGVSDLQDNMGGLKGLGQVWWTPLGVPELSEEIIINAFAWHEKLAKAGGSLGNHAYLIFELFSSADLIKAASSNNTSGSGSSASSTGSAESNSESGSFPGGSGWPRPPGFRHMVLLGAGCAPDADESEAQTARQMLQEGPAQIFGADRSNVNVTPNGLEDFHDVKAIYGKNYAKLQTIKQKYDPLNKLKGNIPPPATASTAAAAATSQT